jgi:CBS domain containing-hemolysin-like protein
MTAAVLLWTALAALMIAGPAAAAARVLHEFSRRELEVYCRRRRRRERFAEILGQHDEVAPGVETLYVLSGVVLLISAGLWAFAPDGGRLPLTPLSLAAASAAAALLFLAVHLWIPLAVVRLWSAPFLYHTWRLWWLASWLMWPLTVGVTVVESLARRLAARHEEPEDEEEAFEDEIRTMVTAGQREGLLEPEARQMIERVIELGDADASDIMTPRSQVDAVEIAMPWSDLLRYAVEAGRTRLPVYDKTLDNIVGILYVKDLLQEISKPADQPHRPLRAILRRAWSVPDTKPLDDLLRDFLRTRNHLAIVRDEYQSVVGVVTIEDVLEEIVGEIVDEWDEEHEDEILELGDDLAEADGRVRIDELNERLALDLPESDDDFDTIGGYVVARLGRIPKPGEKLDSGNVRLTVIAATRRRVERVRIENLTASPRGPA